MKRIICLIVAVVMLFSVAACSSENEDTANSTNATESNSPTYTMEGQDAVAPGSVSDPVNPDKVYSSIEYTPEMFYGDYRILGGEEAQKALIDKVGLMDFATAYNEQLTSLPFRIKAGPNNLTHILGNVKTYDWMELYFQTEDNNLTFLKFAYSVEGNTLTLAALDEYNYDKETNHISYRVSEDKVLKYQFEFNGVELTLSDGTNSVTLVTCLDVYEDDRYIYSEGYLSPGSESLGGIDMLKFRWSDKDNTHFYAELQDGTCIYDGVAQMAENGVLTLTIPTESGTKVYQAVCFCGYNDGMVLCDGTNVYYYNDSYSDRKANGLGGSVSFEELSKIENLPDEKVEDLITKRNSLFDELSAAFTDAGLNVKVDKDTGEIALDSAVLFGFDESAVSDEGKTFLEKFIGIYTSVVFSEKYDGFVSKIVVEGHTDTNGDYDMNLTLSQKRADEVLNYCLSMGISPEHLASFKSIASSVGCSYDNPVFDEAGNVDMDASRRVSFKFIINLG